MVPHIAEIINGVNWKLTGSHVLNMRYCKDWDIICYEKDILIPTSGNEYIRTAVYKGERYEFLLADKQSVLQRILLNWNIPDLVILYILKKGHIHIAGRKQEEWEKHRLDLEILENSISKKYQNDFALDIKTLIFSAKKDTDLRVNQKTPKLNGVSNKEFFDDNVKKYVDHDYIHKVVAYDTGIPAYTKMQKDNGTVTCYKELWHKNMCYTEKLQAVAEECSVIAIERHMLPQYIENTAGKPLFLAYKWALWRVCTNLCSGFFREFAIDNYYTVLNMYNETKLNDNIEAVLKTIKYGNGAETIGVIAKVKTI